MLAVRDAFEALDADLIMQVVRRVIDQFHINLDELHNDSTSVSVYGAYRGAEEEGRVRSRPTLAVTLGHSKDHRHDLKQLLYILTVSNDGRVRRQARPCQSDPLFREQVRQLIEQVERNFHEYIFANASPRGPLVIAIDDESAAIGATGPGASWHRYYYFWFFGYITKLSYERELPNANPPKPVNQTKPAQLEDTTRRAMPTDCSWRIHLPACCGISQTRESLCGSIADKQVGGTCELEMV